MSKEKTTIPSDDNMGEFGMNSMKEVKYSPNKVKEVDDLENVVSIE